MLFFVSYYYYYYYYFILFYLFLFLLVLLASFVYSLYVLWALFGSFFLIHIYCLPIKKKGVIESWEKKEVEKLFLNFQTMGASLI